MTQLKWGGTFSTLDPMTRLPVRGSIGGEFVGDFPDEQAAALKSIVLARAGDVLGHSGSILSALTDLGDLSRRLTASIEGPVSQVGARGQATVAFARIDPMNEAMLRAKSRQ